MKTGYPSSEFYHRIDGLRSIILVGAVTTGMLGSAWIGWSLPLLIAGIVFLVAAGFLYGSEHIFLSRGKRLTRELGLKEYMPIPTGMKIEDIDLAYEMHIQMNYSLILLYMLRKITGRLPCAEPRIKEMVKNFYTDMEIISKEVNEGRWQGKTIGIVATTHISIMKRWEKAVIKSGGKFYRLDKVVDPRAKLSRLGWWITQVTTIGQLTVKTPPQEWFSCVAIYGRDKI